MFVDPFSKRVNLGGKQSTVDRSTLLANQRKERADREFARRAQSSQICIARIWRGYIARCVCQKNLLSQIDAFDLLHFLRCCLLLKRSVRLPLPPGLREFVVACTNVSQLKVLLSGLVRVVDSQNNLSRIILDTVSIDVALYVYLQQPDNSIVARLVSELAPEVIAQLAVERAPQNVLTRWVWLTWERRSDVVFSFSVYPLLSIEGLFDWQCILTNMLTQLGTQRRECLQIATYLAQKKQISLNRSFGINLLENVPLSDWIDLILAIVDFSTFTNDELLPVALGSNIVELVAERVETAMSKKDVKILSFFVGLFSALLPGLLSSSLVAAVAPLIPKLVRFCYEQLTASSEEWIFLVFFLKKIHAKKNVFATLANDAVWEIPESVRFMTHTPMEDERHIVHSMPYVIPFRERVKLFNATLAADQGRYAASIRTPWADRVKKIGRNRLVEDGLANVWDASSSLKEIVRIEFVAPDGTVEAGIDGGGLFKEFLHLWLREVLSPEYGLFEQLPNGRVSPQGVSSVFKSIGRAVGKALYEMVLLETHFGESFLSRVIGGPVSLDQLEEVDEPLFKSLKYIHESSVDDLGLYFAFDEGELIPNGANIPVTNSNKSRYIILASWFHLTRRLDRAAAAFAAGLDEIIPVSWLSIFSPSEINLLISGEQREGFDVDDLRNNTVYGGGYASSSETIRLFWEVLQELSPSDQSAFLSFVTSCPRPPLLGFKVMHPKFAINRVPEKDRLPTASTCANLFKLPDYQNKQVLWNKLQMAIHSQSGFDLS